jgi:hypothetical protein
MEQNILKQLNGITPENLKKLLALVNAHHSKHAAFTFHSINSDFFQELKKIIKDVSVLLDLLDEKAYVATRRVNPSDSHLAYQPHFDNYESTVLIPLITSNSEMNGDIFLWENTRQTPTNPITHFIVKILFQNKFSTILLKKLHLNKSRFQKFKRHSIGPGDYLIFNGFLGYTLIFPLIKENACHFLFTTIKSLKALLSLR